MDVGNDGAAACVAKQTQTLRQLRADRRYGPLNTTRGTGQNSAEKTICASCDQVAQDRAWSTIGVTTVESISDYIPRHSQCQAIYKARQAVTPSQPSLEGKEPGSLVLIRFSGSSAGLIPLAN